MVDFRILGPLEVVADDGPVRLAGTRQRATLASLLLSANRVVSVDRLADDLYAGAPPVTAVTQVQRQVSELRRALGDGAAIETRPPGYVLRLAPHQLDLKRFERLTADAARARERDDLAGAARLLRDALALWRGDPLADLAREPFARAPIGRLEEVRLVALEQLLDVKLALGRHAEVVGELEQLVAEEPLRERPRALLMLALYRSGRQAEALDVYRRAREALVDELGIEPGAELRALERAILTQDASLDANAAAPHAAEPASAVLVLPQSDDAVDGLLALATRLASAGRELIVAQLVTDDDSLGAAAAALAARRSTAPPIRTAAFTSTDRAADAARLATTYDASLVIVAATAGLEAVHPPGALAELLARSPASVAVLGGSEIAAGMGGGVAVPFGGGAHDWAALELGAWLSAASAVPLRLIGTAGDPERGRRDASRLLADASLAVQRVAGVVAEPVLADRSAEALVEAVSSAAIVVAGISPRWRREGIGAAPRALVAAGVPYALVHRGARPGGLAPLEARTRFSWSLEG